MKKYYFNYNDKPKRHDYSYRSQWSVSKNHLLDDTKEQILKSVEAGKTGEASIWSDLLTTAGLSDRYRMFTSDDSLTLEGAYKYGIKELLCEGKVVKLNDRSFHVPSTDCEKTLAKRLTITLAHYNPKDS